MAFLTLQCGENIVTYVSGGVIADENRRLKVCARLDPKENKANVWFIKTNGRNNIVEGNDISKTNPIAEFDFDGVTARATFYT